MINARPLLASAAVAIALTAAASFGVETVTSFAPSTNTDPGVWYENDVRLAGTASIVNLSGAGGDLEALQPLPIGAALVTTTLGDTGDKGEVGVINDYGTPDDTFATLSITYSYYKAANGGQNASAAPALKLAFFNEVCDDPLSAGDCFGTLVYEPTWNQPGFEGSSVVVPEGVWTTVTIDETTGLFWWTGGFGEPNTAGGPPLHTLADWKTIFTSDFGDSTLFLVSVGVGTFNIGQIGYFDNVQISHSGTVPFSAEYDFEGAEIENIDTGELFAGLQDAIDDPDTLDGHTLEIIVAEHTTPETQIEVTKSVTIQGGSPDTLRPSADTASSGDARGWFLIDFGKDVTFRDLIFDGTGHKIWQAIRNHGTLTVEDCEFTEIKFEEGGPSYAGTAIATFDATGLLTVRDTILSEIGRIGIHVFEPSLIERCTYTGKGAGDHLDYFMCVGSFGASVGIADIIDCTSTDCVGVASVDGSTSAGMLVTTFFGPGTDAFITGCTFTGNTVGVAVGFDAADTSTVKANFNNIFGNTDLGMVNTSTTTVVDAKENWWGDAGGPDDPPGVIPAINGACADVVDIFNLNPPGNGVTDLNVCYCSWAILFLSSRSGDLTLEIGDCPDDAFTGESGYQIEVEVWMRDLTSPTTGFQAFIEFDDGVISYRGDLSTYTVSPFPLHIQDIATADVAAGEIRIDGSDDLGDPGTVLDSLLATLVFDVDVECSTTSIDFDLTQDFDSELSVDGDPIPTTLVNTDSITLDDTPPVITCPADITQAADANVGDGCVSAIVTFTATATDNCDATPTVVCTPPSGSAFLVGTTTVTCTATDDCGNESECMFDVTVTATNVVCLDIQLVGVTTNPIRCINLQTDDCTFTDIELDFDDGPGLFSGEIEIPCGNWTFLCGKDEQHTLFDTTTLTLSGTKYIASTTLDLLAGDTDNDGDVDINDVTFLVSTFGDAAVDGFCPFDGTRDADFSNNGTVASEDYSLLTPNWLLITDCACTISTPQSLIVTRVRVADLEPWMAKRVDLLQDGVFDWRDVSIFERRNGLPDTLSQAMRQSGR